MVVAGGLSAAVPATENAGAQMPILKGGVSAQPSIVGPNSLTPGAGPLSAQPCGGYRTGGKNATGGDPPSSWSWGQPQQKNVGPASESANAPKGSIKKTTGTPKDQDQFLK
jgi:hypothetical protein